MQVHCNCIVAAHAPFPERCIYMRCQHCNVSMKHGKANSTGSWFQLIFASMYNISTTSLSCNLLAYLNSWLRRAFNLKRNAEGLLEIAFLALVQILLVELEKKGRTCRSQFISDVYFLHVKKDMTGCMSQWARFIYVNMTMEWASAEALIEPSKIDTSCNKISDIVIITYPHAAKKQELTPP